MVNSQDEIRRDYKIRIDRVFRYIEEHLDAQILLSTVSEIACFSPYHFHRLFKALTGETLNQYTIRRKVEKAAADLLHEHTPVTQIVDRYGFSEPSAFTRTFKKFYGMSPTEFRRVNSNRFSKIRQVVSKIGQSYPDAEQYICVLNNLKNWITMNAKIQIKDLTKMDVACISCTGHQELQTAYQTLIRWAGPIGLLDEHTKMITVYHDSFKITEADKVRMDACILVNKPVKAAGEVVLSTISSGKFIVGSFEIGLDEFEKSWTGLFLWMNENGYRKAGSNPFELYHNDFNKHPEKKAIVDLHIPVE